MERVEYSSIDQYIGSFSGTTHDKLVEIRNIIKAEATEAKEKISYGMPTFDLFGNLVHFAGYAKHIGFYPSPSGIEAFKDEVSAFKYAKGSVQFPLNAPLPADLIRRIVRFRVVENMAKASGRKKR